MSWLVSGCSTFKGRASPTFWDPPVPPCACDTEHPWPVSCSFCAVQWLPTASGQFPTKICWALPNCTKGRIHRQNLAGSLAGAAHTVVEPEGELGTIADCMAVGMQKVPVPFWVVSSPVSTWQDLVSKMSLSAVFQGVKSWLVFDLKNQKMAYECSHDSLLGKSDSLSPFP